MSPGTDGMSPKADVLLELCPGGGGTGALTDGISPALAEQQRAHVKAMVMNILFMGSPLRFNDARFLTSERIEQLPEILARHVRAS